MNQRIICKGLTVAVIILFLGLAIQPSIAVQPETEIDIEQTEQDNNKEDVSIFNFCILHVWAYVSFEGNVFASFVRLKCKDLDTGKIRNRITGLFGHYFFIGLKQGHTYKITATEFFNVSVVIELKDFWNYIDMDLWRFG